MTNKALFLDRDGVINHDIGYAFKAEDIEFQAGIFDLCTKATALGYKLVIVTNQSGIARGYYSTEDFNQLMDWMCDQLEQQGATITGVYHCPHHPDFSGDCTCRKPASGMLQQAIDEHNLSPSESIMIGDKPSDMMAAASAGVQKRILLHNPGTKRQSSSECTDEAESLAEIIPLL